MNPRPRSATLRSFLRAVAAAVLICGCAGPPPTILLQASPNPFPGHRGYALTGVQIGEIRVGDMPAAQWLATRSPEQQRSFDADLAALSSRFAEAVVSTCGLTMGVSNATDGGGGFVIRPTLIRVGIVASTSTDQYSRLTVRIVSPQGTPLDAVMLHDSGGGYAVGDRMRHAGTTFGRQLCDYLRTRSQG